jgi:tetratricopeptide (TPR) repeat protein
MISRNDAKAVILYEFLETTHNYFEGNWKAIKEYDPDLVERNLSIGEMENAVQYLHWHGLPRIYQGYPDITKSTIGRLKDISEVYANDFSLMLKYELNANLLMEYRRLHDALSEVGEAIGFAQKAGFGIFLFDMYSCKALIHILMGDIEKAEESMRRASEIKKAHAFPIELSSLYRSQVECNLHRLKQSIGGGNGSGSAKCRNRAAKSCKMLLRISRKAAQHRTESCRLTGVYYWLTNNQQKALKWWHRAIQEGERLGARLELSRAYFEIGKRLLEPKSKHEMLDGIKAEEYLERARSLFEEMDLQWDLDELNRVARG